jgi:hypothetical protein
MAEVEEVWRYPVKSMGGEPLEACVITDRGLEGDRRWALVDGVANRAGKLLSIRQDERLMTYRARLADAGVEIVTPDGDVRRLDDAMVSHIAQQTARPLTLRDIAGANFDDSPVLVVNLATVEAFGLEAGFPIDRRRFRANLYVGGLEPEEELGWLGRRIRAGDAELEVIKRCDRCVVITRDPETTAATPQLLRILTQRHQTCMGLYCGVVRPGRVAVGDLCGPV